jgi:hypothetical protein
MQDKFDIKAKESKNEFTTNTCKWLSILNNDIFPGFVALIYYIVI